MAALVRRSACLWALVVLAALGAAFVGPAEHADDGCQVEQHCLACRVAIATVGADPGAAAPIVALVIAARIHDLGEPRAAEAPYLSPDSNRGPPRTA
jgi:hypothetical protein